MGKESLIGIVVFLVIIIFIISIVPERDSEIEKEIRTYLQNWDCNGDKVKTLSKGEPDNNEIYIVRLLIEDYPCISSDYNIGLGTNKYKNAKDLCIIVSANDTTKEIIRNIDGYYIMNIYIDTKYCGNQEYEFNETKFKENLNEGLFNLINYDGG